MDLIDNDDTTLYHPLSGAALADGTLFVPVSGRDAGGEIWDGAVCVAADHPRYLEWAEMIQNKEVYLAADREQRRVEREARIEAGRRRRDAG